MTQNCEHAIHSTISSGTSLSSDEHGRKLSTVLASRSALSSKEHAYSGPTSSRDRQVASASVTSSAYRLSY